MGKLLQEELTRMIELSYYGRTTYSNIKNKYSLIEEEKVDDPKKADLVNKDVEDFFKTLEEASKSGGLKQQSSGSMSYQKAVESLQIGLTILGYELPRHGVDGYFGPETASAIEKFKSDNLKDTKTT
jgi:peptidoglycan hydrolase-like protein with peptidoglycan-binding domain